MNEEIFDPYKVIWEGYHKAVCSINFFGSSGCKIFGISGFKHANKIITDDYAYNLKEVKEIVIHFYEKDGNKVFREIKYDSNEFKRLLPDKKQFSRFGFSYIRVGKKKLAGLPELEFCRKCEPTIGLKAVSIAYHFDTNNLSLKPALISSYVTRREGVDFIQYDGMVMPGSSGAPLLDLSNGKVIGILANKELHVVKVYREMQKTADNNLDILEKVKGKWTFDDVDPIQVMIVNQNQMKHMAKEFFGSFAIRSGYAIQINYIKEMLEADSELDFE